MIYFKSESEYNVAGKGRVFVVNNPIPPTKNSWIEDYSFLKDTKINIDGKEFYVRGIECFAYGGKRREKDKIGILVNA